MKPREPMTELDFWNIVFFLLAGMAFGFVLFGHMPAFFAAAVPLLLVYVKLRSMT